MIPNDKESSVSDRKSDNPRSALFRDRNFRRIAGGAAVSLFGDQFSMIALPWLVLKLTGDTFEMGIVLITMNIPRVVFILLGGALVDRYSAKRILMLSQAFNGLLIGALAVLVLTGHLSIWMVYGLALGIGFASAFSMPSWSTIVAQAVTKEQLPIANSISASTMQISTIVGPLLAGLLIASLGSAGAGASADTQGLGLAFLLDFASFCVACWALSGIAIAVEPATSGTHKDTLKAVMEGLRHFWHDRSLRTAYLYGVTIMFFVGGPIQVAMPVLARQWGHGASAYGILMSALGVGTIIGVTLFGIRPRFRIGNIGTTMLAIDFIVGVLLLPMGQIHGMVQAGLTLLVIGILSGFLQLMIFNWVQCRVPPAILGRVMSVCLFLMMAVPLVSIATAGWLMRSMPASSLLSISGSCLIVIVLVSLVATSMRYITESQSPAELER